MVSGKKTHGLLSKQDRMLHLPSLLLTFRLVISVETPQAESKSDEIVYAEQCPAQALTQ